MTWAGDSPLRRLVAWLGQTAILLALGIIGIVIVMQVLVPMMTGGLVQIFQNGAP
jgi:hypothetical protein